MASPCLIGLPHELLHKVICECEPANLASLLETCRALYQFLSNNRQLYKEMFLRKLDLPRTELDYEAELKQFVTFKRILDCDDVEKKVANLPYVADQISHYLSILPPKEESFRTVPFLSEITNDLQNWETFFCNSGLFQRVRSSSNSNWAQDQPRDSANYIRTEEQRQASAKLHSLCGIPLLHLLHSSSPRPSTRSARTYPYAVSIVYDLRNYTDGTLWGPFKDDGQATVDWEKIEAIIIVLGHNIQEFAKKTSGSMKILCNSIWSEPWKHAIENSCDAVTEPRLEEPGLSLDARDPYGVTGTYLRIVCFLDFTELYAYNFSGQDPLDPGTPRPPLDTIEASRLILMDLKVTRITSPGEDDGQDYPVVHFRGTSRSVDSSYDPNANSNIRGTVRQTPEGEIRWTTYSIYHGEERWKSESIQVGGIRSARGAIGHWFDKDYDIHGPAGPTAFWKISDESLEQMLVDEDSEAEDEEDEDWDGGEDEGEDEEQANDEDVVMIVDQGVGGIISFLLQQDDIQTSGNDHSLAQNAGQTGNQPKNDGEEAT